MNSFSIQAVKDTLNDMHGVITSKVIPTVGTFFGKSVTVISANPLATAVVVAAVITVSLLIFAAYKHYQNHQQLKANVISLNNDFENVKEILNNEKKYYIDEKKDLENQNTDLRTYLKEVKAELVQLKEDRALDQEAAELVVADQFVKIAKLEKQILSK